MSALLALAEAMTNSRPRVVATTLSVIIFWVFAAWSLGFVPAFGAGFASAETVNYIQISLVETAIIDRRTRYCEAPRGSDVRKFFLKSVSEKLIEYRMLTGADYNLPTCEELVFERQA